MRRAVLVLLFSILTANLFADDLERQATRELSASNTGAVNQTTAEGAGATNRDFFSKLIMAVESAEAGKPITLDWNHTVGMLKKSTLQFETVLTQPDLFSAFASKLTSDTAAAFKKELSYTDDVAATLSWSSSDKDKDEAETASMTTAFVRSRQTYMTGLAARRDTAALKARQAAVAAPNGDQARAAADEEVVLALEERAAHNNLRSFASEIGITSSIDDDDLAVKTAARLAARKTEQKSKYYVSGTYHYRSNHAGPKEWKLKGTYELPLSAVSTSTEEKMQVFMAPSGGNLHALSTNDVQQVAQDTKRAARNTRLAFSVETSGSPSLDIVGGGQSVHSPSSHSYVGRASWGSNVYTPVDPTRTGRLEMALSYDDVTGDPNKNKRFVGALTYTQKINEKTSLPIALVYGSKPQYVGDVNKRLGVHFGLSFKLSDM